MRLILCVLALMGSVAVRAQAQQQQGRVPAVGERVLDSQRRGGTTRREHFVVRDSNNNVYFEITQIFTMTDVRKEGVVVVWDHGTGQGLRFRNVSDYENKQATITAEEINGGSFVRIEFDLPFTGRTVTEVIQESRTNPKVLETYNTPLTYVTNTVRRTTLESQWRDDFTARAWRSELRTSLAPAFLESIERLRDLALSTHPVFNAPGSVLKNLYFGHAEVSEHGKLIVETAPPDCRFDADMGHECTDAQLKRVADAEKGGKPLTVY